MTQINNQNTSNFHEVYSKLLGISKGEVGQEQVEVAPHERYAHLRNPLRAAMTCLIE